MQLAQRLVQNDPDRRRKIEAANLSGRHGNSDVRGRVLLPHAGRQTLRFRAEEQAIAIGESGFCVKSLGGCLDEPDVLALALTMLGEGLGGADLKNLTPQPPSLRGKGEPD